ncbi:spermidine synthase [Thiocapsa imhoffii]|nr:fused MFS/spermidine synthase [Thiocapsa imhoffii]
MSASASADRSDPTRQRLQSVRPLMVLVLFFGSGLTALLLQTLWMRELALLFGSGAQAAAATLAAFFLGLAAGGAFWGVLSPRLRQPLRWYGLLELGVALGALGCLFLLPTFHGLYGALYDQVSAPRLLLAVKLALALMLLFPAAFCMGGTLPVLSPLLAGTPGQRTGIAGRWLPVLYGVNTLGAAVGAFAAAFVLPQAIGWRWSYWLAILIAAGVGVGAWWLSTRVTALDGSAGQPVTVRDSTLATAQSWGTLRFLAFLSGFVTLALEVLWTRMFAQVLHNSVYSFAAILIVFLIALGIGALLVSGFSRQIQRTADRWLGVLLISAGLLVATTPLVFMKITDGLGYLGHNEGWIPYLATLFSAVTWTLFLPTLVLGLVFPTLLRLAASHPRPVGQTVGTLVALNTLGAIAGALAAGFLFLDWLGLWRSIGFMAALYLAAVLWLPWLTIPTAAAPQRRLRIVALMGLLSLLSVIDLSRLPIVRIDHDRRGEMLVQVWESGAGTVAVVRRGDDLRIKVDNHYTLGGTAGRGYEERQAHLPLLLHPAPEEVFFIGLGTGITAGAALHHPVRRVVVAELLPHAIIAARTHFAPWQNGLFDDPRVRVLATDGRNHLAATRSRFDVMIGDLFIPWEAGAGNLYTIEHFTRVRERLAPGGLFAQWLPLYQLSEQEFGSIARTFSAVFPQVTLWRGDFLPHGPIVALIGAVDAQPLDGAALREREQALAAARNSPFADWPAGGSPLLLFYAGNLGELRERLEGYPLSTDARPIIELRAPRTQRQQAAGQADWFTGSPLVAFFEDLQRALPPAVDPYLSRLDEAGQGVVTAGLEGFRTRLGTGSRTTRPVNPVTPDEEATALREELRRLRAARDDLERWLPEL